MITTVFIGFITILVLCLYVYLCQDLRVAVALPFGILGFICLCNMVGDIVRRILGI